MIKVHGVSLSPFVRKVLLTLEYKGIDYELSPVFPGSDDPEFRKISPLGKIPVLEHDGFFIADSSCICRYLDNTFPEKSIYPESFQDDARASWLEEFADSRLVEALAGLFRQRFFRPKFLGKPAEEDKVKRVDLRDLPFVTIDERRDVSKQNWYLDVLFPLGPESPCGGWKYSVWLAGAAYASNSKPYLDWLHGGREDNDRPHAVESIGLRVCRYRPSDRRGTGANDR